MEKRQILDIGEHLIPDNSMAETAALVTLPDGGQDIVEIFGGTNSYGFRFTGQPTVATYQFRTKLETEQILNTNDITLDIDSMLESFDTGEGGLFPLSEVTQVSDFSDRMDLYAINCILGVIQPIHTVDD